MSGVSLGHYYGQKFVEGDVALLDHSYCRPFQSLVHHNSKYTKEPRTLLQVEEPPDPGEEVDVCGGITQVVPPFDQPRNAHLINETERFLLTHCSSKLSEEHEDWMSRVTWNPEQHAIFARVMKIIDTARLARLSSVGHNNESVMRAIYTAHAARQLRKTFAMIKWERELSTWLHNTLFSALSLRLLAIYIDMLQHLDHSLPQLVTRLLEGHKINNPARSALTSADTILAFLRRTSNPTMHLATVKPTRIAGNPLILIVPHYLDAEITESALFSRLSNIKQMGKIRTLNITQPTDKIKTASQYSNTLVKSLHHAISTTIAKHDNKNIFALSWGIGSLTLLHVASTETLRGAVCIGLPLSKKHRPLRNIIADIKCPVLFIVGTGARHGNVKDVETLVNNVPGDKRLVFIEGADDNLCIPMSKQVECGLTQSMLDQIVLDEIGNFFISIAGYSPPTREELQEYEEQEIARHRKRKIEATALSVRKMYPQIISEDHILKRKPTKRASLEKNKQEPIKKEKKKRKIKVRKSDSPFDYSVSDSERNDVESLGSLLPERSKLLDTQLEERFKTPETSPSQSPQPGPYEPKPYSSYSKFKSSSTAESYMKTYHLSKLRGGAAAAAAAADGYMMFPGSRGTSPTYNSGYSPNLAKGTPSIYQSSVGFSRWN